MDFLEDLFEFGKRKHKKSSDVFYDKRHKDHDDDDDDDDDDDKRRRYPVRADTQPSGQDLQARSNPVILLSSIVCRRCSTQTVLGAKFCHGCGTAIAVSLSCESCGSKLPVHTSLCSQCGYGN